MTDVQIQYMITSNLLSHIESRIRDAGTAEELLRYRNAKIHLLDVIADLFQNPIIAAQWNLQPEFKK